MAGTQDMIAPFHNNQTARQMMMSHDISQLKVPRQGQFKATQQVKLKIPSQRDLKVPNLRQFKYTQPESI